MPDPVTDPLDDPRQPASRVRRWRRIGLLTLLAVVVAIGAVVAWPLLRSDETEIPPPPIHETADVEESETAMTVRPGFDGSYYLTAEVNGEPTLFRIMPFAKKTILDPGAAEAAGVETGEVFSYVDVLAAAGPVAEAEMARLRIGRLTFEDLPVLVRAEPIGVLTLGQDVLGLFADWGKRGDGPNAPFVIEY